MALIGPKDDTKLGETFGIYEDGKVAWMFKVRKTFSCDFDMARVPFDEHECPITVAAWSDSGEDSIIFLVGYHYYLDAGAVDWTTGCSMRCSRLE